MLLPLLKVPNIPDLTQPSLIQRNLTPFCFVQILHAAIAFAQPTPYNFQYAVRDAASGNDYKQQESSDGRSVQGEYRVLLPDGRNQIVRYRADDATGFNADVQYEGEPHYPSGGGGGGYGGGSNSYLPPRYKK
jgi:hypothetical protein